MPRFLCGRLLFVAVTTSASVLALTGPTFAAAGGLDPTFGNGGTTATTGSNGVVQGTPATVLDAAARTLTVLTVHPKNGSVYVVVERFDSSGHLDTTYGKSGRVVLPASNLNVHKIAIRPSGGALVLGGLAAGQDGESTVVVALTESGAVDTAYGDNGVATAPVTAANDMPRDLLVLGNGASIVAMRGYQPYGFRMVRFTADGGRDMDFGSSGVLSTSWPGIASIGGLAPRSAGGFLAVGDDTPGTGRSLVAAAAYLADGSLDTTFGKNGRALYVVGTGDAYGIGALALASGDVLIPTTVFTDDGGFGYLVRIGPKGGLRSSFGTNGVAEISPTPTGDGISSFVLDGGNVLVSLTVEDGPFVVEFDRVNATSGARDTTFGNGGKLTLFNQALSFYGADSQGRSYDAGADFRSVGPVWILQRRTAA